MCGLCHTHCQGMDSSSLGGAPKTCSSSSKSLAKQAWESCVVEGPQRGCHLFWTRGHMGVSPLSPSREHTALFRTCHWTGVRMRGSVLWFCHCWSGQPWTALEKARQGASAWNSAQVGRPEGKFSCGTASGSSKQIGFWDWQLNTKLTLRDPPSSRRTLHVGGTVGSRGLGDPEAPEDSPHTRPGPFPYWR